MAPKTILFDLDGTLTDSGAGIIGCAQHTLAHFSLPVPDREALRVFVGPPLGESFLRFGVPADKITEAIAVYRERYFDTGKFENMPYPGIFDLLSTLKNQGCDLYIATSKLESISREIAGHFGFTPYFADICGSTLDGSRESKASVIGHILSRLAPGTDVIMVGDTHLDILGAKAHGIPAIGVAWGYGLREEMAAAGALAVAENMEELEHLLSK